MTVTAAQIQDLIILECGDVGGVLATNMATIWDSYADKAGISPRLQELYSKRRCVEIVLGALRDSAVDTATESGLSVKLHQKVDTLVKMREQCQADIDKLEKLAAGARVPKSGALTNVEPVTPPVVLPVPVVPDASDSRYRGDPYKRTWGP